MPTTIQRPTQPTARPIDRILIALECGKHQVMAACDRCETTIAQAAREPGQ